MKIYIRANKTYTYEGYTLYQADGSIEVYKAGEFIGEYPTEKEAESAIREWLHSKDTQVEKKSVVKLPKSCMYKSLVNGKYDLSQVPGLDTVYVLEIEDCMYYSRDGYVAYRDNDMVVFFNKQAAVNVARSARTPYVVTPIKLTADHKLPSRIR